MDYQDITIEQSQEQRASLLAAAEAAVAREQDTITRLKGELAGAYNRRNQWEAEVRRLTPIRRTRKFDQEGGGEGE
jgi:hypothetical protein